MQDGRTFYLAGPFSTQGAMKQRRAIMNMAGLRVDARWIDEPCPSDDAAPNNHYLMGCAEGDYEDVRNCDVFVVFPDVGAGHHTEFGIALALDKQLVVIGKKNNIFHYLGNVYHYDDFDQFLEALKQSHV